MKKKQAKKRWAPGKALPTSAHFAKLSIWRAQARGPRGSTWDSAGVVSPHAVLLDTEGNRVGLHEPARAASAAA